MGPGIGIGHAMGKAAPKAKKFPATTAASDPLPAFSANRRHATVTAQPSPDTAHKLEDSILTRARELRLATLGQIG